MTAASGAALAVPVEELTQLIVQPGNPDRIILRHEFGGAGLLYSEDRGQTFGYVCAASIVDPAADAGRTPSLGPLSLAGDGALLIGTFSGLYSDDGKGCGWSTEPTLAGKWITDIVPHPSDPQISYLITSTGGEVENGIVRRNADGSFTEMGERKEMLLFRLRVVELPEGGLRFYESGVLRQVPLTNDAGQMTTKPSYAIRVSDDEGATWIEHELGVLDGSFRLEGVDPSNPDRIIASVARTGVDEDFVPLTDRVLVSTDQGATFEEWTTLTTFGAVAFAEDGRVFLGDAGDNTRIDAPRGLWQAPSLGGALERVADGYPVSCLQYIEGELLACNRFGFGRISLQTGELTPSVELRTVAGFAQCESQDLSMVCRQQLCNAYCGLGHFAVAPMCVEAYDSNNERGCAPIGVGGAGGAVAGGASGASVAGAGGISGGASGTGAGAGMVDAGATLDAGPESDAGDDSGCSCAAVGASRASGDTALLTSALVLLVFGLRRRRALARRDLN